MVPGERLLICLEAYLMSSRFSQTEKKTLAIVWACEQFNLYVFGNKFKLETDHKPLQFIYSKT